MRRVLVGIVLVVLLVAAFVGGRVTAQSAAPEMTVLGTLPGVGFGQLTVIKLRKDIAGGPYRGCLVLYESPTIGATMQAVNFPLCD